MGGGSLRAEPLVACHDCDLLHRLPQVAPGARAMCRRCGSLLQRGRANSLQRTLALTLTSLVLFVLANAYVFMEFKLHGLEKDNHLITGVLSLYDKGYSPLAGLILFTSILAPFLKIVLLLSISVPLLLGRVPRRLGDVFRFYLALRPWGMLEVYLIGVLVAISKLADLASIVFQAACWSFGIMIFVTTAAESALDPRLVWRRIEEAR